MNICVVSPDYPTSKTIDFIFVDQLCRTLASQGYKVTVIAPQSISKSLLRGIPLSRFRRIIQVDENNQMTVYRPLYFTFGNSKIAKNQNIKNFNKSILKVLSKFEVLPDVCYGHFWISAFSVYPYAKKYNIPLFVSSGEEIITFHIEYPLSRIKDFLKYLSGVISVSSKNQSEIISSGLANKNHCVVIPNSVNTNLFYKRNKNNLRNKYNISQNDFVVCFVGQFNQRKGVMRVSKALELLNDKSIKALFMGSGVEQPTYGGILFRGTVDHDMLPDFLNCADVFVLPSLNEGCPNAVVEALACGLPIISSDLPFNYDLLNNKNSILVNPNNINEIASAIKFLKDNSDIRDSMSLNAIQKSTELSLDMRASKIMNYIKIRTSEKQ